jgi:eukaryotic-like serine/threonine-protein kinase
VSEIRSLTATPKHWEDARGFLQRRVAGFSLFIAALSFSLLSFRLVMPLALGRPRMLREPSLLIHVPIVLSALAAWAVLRRGALSERLIHGVEAIELVAVTWSYLFLAAYLPKLSRPDLLIMLALTYTLVSRAIYVPSTPKRTLLLSILCAAPAAFSAHLALADIPPAMVEDAARFMGVVATDVQVFGITVAVLFSAITTLISVGTSKVIYGLRAEVRDVRKLGQYTLEAKLGEGGMGIVHRASHAMLRRPTAIKLLPPDRTSEATIARFEREVQLTARLTHPNTVTVFDYGRTPDDVFYYAMELIDGISIATLVENEGAQPAGRVIHILLQIAGALGEAHRIGLIHRDVKPANVMLCERGGVADTVKVLDFGLVKQIAGDDGLATRADIVTGTPMYMSPEAIRSPERVDARSDLYSLAAVGYYLLTGRHLFTGANAVEVCGHHLHTEPRHPAEALGAPVPGDLAAVLLKSLAKEPASRHADAAVMRSELLSCEDAGAWTQEQADAWWTRERTHLRPERGEAGASSAILERR